MEFVDREKAVETLTPKDKVFLEREAGPQPVYLYTAVGQVSLGKT